MTIRRLVFGLVVVLSVLVAGCGGGSDGELPGTPIEADETESVLTPSPTDTLSATPVPDLEFVDLGNNETANGTLLVWVALSNPHSEKRTATVVADIDVGNESYVRNKTVTVEPNERIRVEWRINASYAAFREDGWMQFHLANRKT